MRGMSEEEKITLARCLAATPDERWEMNVARLKLLGLWNLSAEEKLKWNSIL